MSFIPDWLSDALCSLSTGAGFRTRALHTDATEMIFSAARPIMMNGITDMVKRGDLLDRTLMIKLEPIADKDRRTEADVDATFRHVRPAILAALADAVVQALRAPVTLTSMPRMADFATTVESAAPALGWQPEAFLDAYKDRRIDAINILLDNDHVALGMELLCEQRLKEKPDDPTWVGTSEELREAIKLLTPSAKHDKLPKSGKGMIGTLKRLAPGLRTKGIDVLLPTAQETSGERRGQRVIRIVWNSDDVLGAREEDTHATHVTDDIPF